MTKKPVVTDRLLFFKSVMHPDGFLAGVNDVSGRTVGIVGRPPRCAFRRKTIFN
jgi:hypothetical protein